MLESGRPRQVLGHVSHIAIYPVKGCGKIEVQRAKVSPSGLEGDREYMVVRGEPDSDQVYRFLSQRDKRWREEARPQTMAVMALVWPEIHRGVLRLTWKGNDPIAITHDGTEREQLRVRVHRDVVSAVDQGDSVARWLTENLGLSARLVKAEGSFYRLADQTYMKSTNPINFQDAYPIHWVMQESVDELSRVAGEEIPWTRFRPNIVGEDGEPRSEHEMHEGEIGSLPFVQPKPCSRCPVTTVDQELGERRDSEPLKSLSSYMRWNRTGEVLFGENIAPLQSGEVKLGDEISMTSRRQPPIVYGQRRELTIAKRREFDATFTPRPHFHAAPLSSRGSRSTHAHNVCK